MGTTALADEIRTTLATAGTVYRDRAPTSITSPPAYAVLRVTTHGNQDGLTALIDATVDVYCNDDVSAAETLADALDAALRGRVLTNTTAFWLSKSQSIPESDPRVARRQLVFNSTWASGDAATALGGGR